MKYILAFILLNCSSNTPVSKINSDNESIFTYTDEQGESTYDLKFAYRDNKMIFLTKLFDQKASEPLLIEKSITVLARGRSKKDKRKLMILPVESEYEVWLDGKKNQTRTFVNKKEKKIIIQYTQAIDSTIRSESFSFPQNSLFCYFNQIPYCIKELYLNSNIKKGKNIFMYVIWESYPFHHEIYAGFRKNFFYRTKISFEQESKSEIRFSAEIEDQIITYHFSKKMNWLKMNWINQGISMERSEN